MVVRKMVTMESELLEVAEKTVGKKNINRFVEDVLRDALRDNNAAEVR